MLAAEPADATVRWVDFDPATGELTVETVTAALTDRTRLVAVTAASNLLGTRPDVRAIAAAAHAVGALVYVDGVHLHRPRPRRRGRARRRLLRLLALQVLRPAPRRAGRRPRLLDGCGRTSCCPPPTRCPSGSSSAPCRTSCWRATTAAIDYLAGLAGTRRADASGWRTPFAPPRSTRRGWSGASRQVCWSGLGATGTAGHGGGRRPCCSTCPASRRPEVDARLAGRGVLPRPATSTPRGVAAPRPRRPGCGPRRAGPVQRRPRTSTACWPPWTADLARRLDLARPRRRPERPERGRGGRSQAGHRNGRTALGGALQPPLDAPGHPR